MLTAKKSRWFESVFRIYNRNLLQRRFNSFRVSGIENLDVCRESPVLLYANHSSWWDGLVAFHLSKRASLDSYVMMEERQLREYPLFRRLGAFSVVREDRRAAYRSIEYASELIRDSDSAAIWIFPQGEIMPARVRPLEFYGGIAKLVELAGGCQTVPVGISYEFRGNFKPEIFVTIGQSSLVNVEETKGRSSLVGQMASTLGSVLDKQDVELRSGDFESYDDIL